MLSNQTFHDTKPITNFLTNRAKTCKNFVFKKTEVCSLCKFAPNLYHIDIGMRPPNLNLGFFFIKDLFVQSLLPELCLSAKPRVAIDWKVSQWEFSFAAAPSNGSTLARNPACKPITLQKIVHFLA